MGVSRIRSVKPEFWTDETLSECSVSARLLFIGTWNFADDYGNLDRSAKQLKAQVFPYDAIDCEPLIVELMTHGLLTEYSVSDKAYLHIKGFTKHQLINRPSKPKYPDYHDSLRTHGVLTEGSRLIGSDRIVSEGKGTRLEESPKLKPEPLDRAAFPAVNWPAVDDYVAYRVEQRLKPLKLRGITELARFLSAWPMDVQAAMIAQSMRFGWTGVFELKAPLNGSGALPQVRIRSVAELEAEEAADARSQPSGI